MKPIKKIACGILLSAILLNSEFQISANATGDKIKNSKVQLSNNQNQKDIPSKLTKLISEIDQATFHANNEPSLENWNYVSALCNQVAQIYLSIDNQSMASAYSDLANESTAKLFKAEANIAWEEAEENPTDINWEKTSDLFAKAAQEYNKLDNCSSDVYDCCNKALLALTKSANIAAKNAEKAWEESKLNQWKRAETLFNKLYNYYLFLNKKQEAHFCYSLALFSKAQGAIRKSALNPTFKKWKETGNLFEQCAAFHRNTDYDETNTQNDSFSSNYNSFFKNFTMKKEIRNTVHKPICAMPSLIKV